jgi:hypothetical protein
MLTRLLLIAIAMFSVLSADTLTLRDGRTVQGQFLGGTARQIRMAVGDSVRTFDVGDVASLQFEDASAAAQPAPAPMPAPASPAPAPEPAAAPVAEGPKVLHEEPSEPPASAPETSAAVDEIPAGTPITIRMIDGVDSRTAQAGQTFRASVDDPVMVGDQTVIPRGADVITKLVEVQEPGKLAGGGQLTLSLVSLTIDGRPVAVNTQSFTMAGESRKGQSAKVIGGTAALGAIIGAIAGGGKGAAVGAVAGGGAGTAVQVLTKGPEVRIPSETRLTFALEQPVRL